MLTEAVTCPHCNATYPEGEPHACVPQPANSRWSAVLWPLKLATGITFSLVGSAAASIWMMLEHAGYGDSPIGMAAAVFAIILLGCGLWIVFRLLAAQPWKG